jgi:hypothetical protein
VNASRQEDPQVPVFKNRSAFEIARGVRAFLNIEAGITRGEVPPPGSRPVAPRASGRPRRDDARGREREWGLWPLKARTRGINPNNLVWVFGAGRTGSTWLAAMMGELEGHAVWFEPWVGELFNPHHMKVGRRKGKSFILAPHYKETWLRSIRSFVLDGANARFSSEVGKKGYLIAKEPGGSAGSTLLMQALPESRMILLIRDPRDVAASWLDAGRKGSWGYKKHRADGPQQDAASDVQPDTPASIESLKNIATRYLTNVGEAKRAYEAHEGRKVLIKYEDLRADTLGTMKRLYSTLEIPVDEEELIEAVKKHSWESIPKEKKGEGKFYRKARPGGWREDLTPEQAEIVEHITAPLLHELYPTRDRTR